MFANIGISMTIGAIPFLGDAFDIYWKPNRRNYQLLVRHINEPRRHHLGDWLFLLGLLTGIALLFLIPAIVTVLAFFWLAHSLNWM
jgi:hypothetical protein